MRSQSAALFITLLTLGGCASEPKQSYTDRIAQIPAPTNEAERQSKCTWLRSEIARQQNMAAYAASQVQGTYALAAQMQTRNNIAVVESRASDFGCYAAFSGSRPEASSISSCVAACKENTSRTPEQCFDSCNH